MRPSLQNRLVLWSERRPVKADKSVFHPKSKGAKRGAPDPAFSALLERILLTVLVDSARDLSEFENVRVGRAIDMITV